ncbi:hypothetical protein [Streptomyces sp. NPDC007063]|uniref:hypothetical protein n=1 Tax=Streptomyces sp. NPDC007063 TaxID=3364772 RepID=UPI0036D01797
MTGRAILGADRAGRLPTRIVKDHLGFDLPVRGADRRPDRGVPRRLRTERGRLRSPCSTVDMGRHAFILHPYGHTERCDRVVGCYLHPVPDLPEEDGEHGFIAPTVRVVEAPPGPRTVGTLLVRTIG